jgi:plasmid stabilization system protein ParE
MPAKYSVEITPAAERDVEEIWSYIAADSQESATAFILRLEEQIETLEQYPERCPLIPENEQLGTSYRHLLYGAYRTIFRIIGTSVVILRIIHGSRLLDSSFYEMK